MDKFFVIGNPVEHSLSPRLHNYWIKNNNLNAIYDKKKLEINDLQHFVEDIKKEKVKGANVTVPFKKKIIPFIDKLSPQADATQSVNTIYTDENKVIGHNTDIEGFEKALKKINFDLSNKVVLILGAGGVVPSLIYALKNKNISKIIVTNRTKERANELKKLFSDLEIIDWGNVIDFDVVINATSIGLNENDKISLDFSKVGKGKLFYDVIYRPEQTNFLKKGKELGNLTENGKLMFIYQALSAFNLWHKTSLNIDEATIKILET